MCNIIFRFEAFEKRGAKEIVKEKERKKERGIRIRNLKARNKRKKNT